MTDSEVNRIVSIVKRKIHTNDYEHTNIWAFYQAALASGFLGLLVGSAIEQFMKEIEKRSIKPDSRIGCGLLLWIQLSIIALVLFIGNAAPFIRKILFFDDWLMGTFAGFLFALCFINIQNRLSQNMVCLVFGNEI
jgi:hypothetical protein